MKKIFTLLVSTFLLNSCASMPNYLEMADLNPATRYERFETEHFEFTYQKGYLNFAREAAKHIEHAHTILSPLLKWTPRSKISVLVADNSDNANGFAMPSLRVGIVLIATPPDQWFSTSYTENWIKLLVFHEYTHVLNIDPTTKWMEWLRYVFGDAIRPNGAWPRWMLEGLAVYMETRTSILGRGRSPYYDAVVRAYYNEGRLGGHSKNNMSYGRLSGDWPYFPGGETDYLFGYHLWNQFAKHIKDEKKMGDYSINSSHRVPFFIDDNLENVTGKNWEDYWDSFVDESKSRYTEQLQKVKNAGETRAAKITNSQYSAVGGTLSPNGEWLAYTETKLDERQGLVLHNFRTREIKKVHDKLQGVSLSFTRGSDKLVYSSVGRNSTFTEFSDLWAYDLEKDSVQQITSGMRAKDPQVSADGKRIIFIATEKATHVLKIADLVSDDNNDLHLQNIQTLYQPREFSILGTPHWLNLNQIVFSLQELNQPESKILQLTAANPSDVKTIVQNGKMNRFPIPCGHELYYVSDKNGIDNVYTSETPVTNVATAVQFPFCSRSGEVYGSLLTSNGFEIVKFAPHETSILTDTMAAPTAPESIPNALQSPDAKISEPSPYGMWKSMIPRQWAPFGYFNFDSRSGITLGGFVLGFDATGKNQYIGNLAYNLKTATFDQGLSYTYYGLRTAITLSEESSTNDIGVDSHFKRTHSFQARLSHLIRWTWSSLRLSPYAGVNWNSYNNISTKQRETSSELEYNHPYIPVGGVKLTFSDEIQSKLGFMSEGGNRVTFETQGRFYQNEFTLWRLMTEYSKYFGLGNHNVLNPKFRYLGSSHPYGQEISYANLKGKSTSDPFDDGTGISLGTIQFRGYSNMTYYVRGAFQTSLDYHFPIDTFFDGKDAAFLQQIHGFIFGENTFIPGLTRNYNLPALGGGLTADTTLFWHLPLSFTLQMQYGTATTYGGDQLFFLNVGGNLL